MAKKKRKNLVWKIVLFSIVTIILFVGIVITAFFSITSNVKLSSDKFINFKKSIVFYDINGEEISSENESGTITNFENLPKNLINAFVSIEDKRFFEHNGIDFRGLFRATFNNLKTFSFKEGASTISQQLIKNTHLTNEKTIKRKLSEMKLALQLEKKYSKNQILEMYLNTIYFGENCFGVTKASSFYFNKKPKDLNLNECATLAGLVKAPSNYSPLSNYEKCNKRKDIVLNEMYKQKYINNSEFLANFNNDIVLNINNSNGNYNYLSLAKKELNEILEYNNVYMDNIKVYTNFDAKVQKDLENSFDSFPTEYNKSAIILDKNSNILAYKSNIRELPHQIGSCIKPLIAYGPSVELNQIEEYSLFLDEKTNFNGYSPSNYADKYYGYITAKDGLAKSSNVVALKILQDVGIEKAKEFINKTDIKLTNNDNSLCIGLGATEKGATLKELTSAYSIFNNDGYYKSASCIEVIKDEFGGEIYSKRNIAKKVFEKDTAFLVNEMLKETVNSGTAKKLKGDIPLYAKTGTVGNYKGNTDAYTISFNKDYIMGVWFGSEKFMNNTVTGGSIPCSMSSLIWQKLYSNKNAPNYFDAPDSLKKISIDKVSFEEDHVVLLADKYAPKKYVKEFYCKKNNNNIKPSSRFSNPKIKSVKTLVNQRGILIELCLTKLTNAIVYKEKISNDNILFDTKILCDTKFLDKDIFNETTTYIALPYVEINGEKHFGKEEKIVVKKDNFLDDEFWLE